MELWHYGVKGMKWGVRRTKEELMRARESDPDRPANGYHKERKYSKVPGEVARYGEYWYNQNGEIWVTTKLGQRDAHARNPSTMPPNTVLEYSQPGKKEVDRILYDSGGVMMKEIHSTNHGEKEKKGAHAHDHDQTKRRYISGYNEKGKPVDWRKLTRQEKKAHRAILK